MEARCCHYTIPAAVIHSFGAVTIIISIAAESFAAVVAGFVADVFNAACDFVDTRVAETMVSILVGEGEFLAANFWFDTIEIFFSLSYHFSFF